MTALLVVDASVVVKWLPIFQHENLVPEAESLLDRWQRGSLELVAPDFIWIEIANVHWRAARQNRCTAVDAQASLALLHRHRIPTVPAEALIDHALQIALLHGRTAYDSLYVALAAASNSALITADQKLVNGLGGSFSVRWLGAI
jgi:predicted nucleic acid-binding protein